jgi:hypothetical protein
MVLANPIKGMRLISKDGCTTERFKDLRPIKTCFKITDAVPNIFPNDCAGEHAADRRVQTHDRGLVPNQDVLQNY